MNRLRICRNIPILSGVNTVISSRLSASRLSSNRFLSQIIVKRRSPKIQKQYDQIGGGSPIADWTAKQSEAMVKHLDILSPETAPHGFYIGFRYAAPLLEDTINQIEKDNVERVVAFSQYPQYSCTTSGSTFNALVRHYDLTPGQPSATFTGVEHIDKPEMLNDNGQPGPIWSFIDRWPVASFLVDAFAQHIQSELDRIEDTEERDKTVLLFSAHSIPLSVVNRGDAYPQEIGATVHAVMQQLNFQWPYRLVWQSKVGPKAWLGPSTADALEGLARLGYRHAMLIPIAFTSDHIETLYEMDIEYCSEVAEKVGMAKVRRCPSINDNADFSKGLAKYVAKHLKAGQPCTRQFMLRCPQCVNASCHHSRQFISSTIPRLDAWTKSHFSS